MTPDLVAHARSGLPWSSRVASSSWYVPGEIELARGSLRWRGSAKHASTLLSFPSESDGLDGLILEFASLGDADDGDVLDFARKRGVLGLCGHGLPHTHVTGVGLGGWRPQYCLHGTRPDADGWTTEGLDRWRVYARQAKAILRVAAAFVSDSHVPDGVWDGFEELEPRWIGVPWSSPDPPKVIARPASEWAGRKGVVGDIRVMLPEELSTRRDDADRLEWALTQWLTLGDVRMWVTHDAEDFRVRFGGGTLFGAMATELALIISRHESLFPCSGCGEPFVDKSGRRSASSKRWWCPKPECRKKALAAAARDSRRKKREKECGINDPAQSGV